ncbi:hypothetical protein Tco_0105479 [Tanacetum coccineum]
MGAKMVEMGRFSYGCKGLAAFGFEREDGVRGLVGDVWELWSALGYLEGVHGGNFTWVDLEMGQKKIEEDSDELEYPQELFSAVDLLSLQFLGAFCTQRKVSMVSFGRISPNRFLSFIVLVVVIIITVMIVVVILVVVIFAIVEVVIVIVVFVVVVVIDGVSLIF